MKFVLIALLSTLSVSLLAQESELTVAKIMQDPKGWVGTEPNSVYWSEDGKTIYFEWNPEQNPSDSLYKISAPWNNPVKVSRTEQAKMPSRYGTYSKDRSRKLYTRNGDIYLYEVKGGKERQLTRTSSNESDPSFSKDGSSVYYSMDRNLFRLDLEGGMVYQLTNFEGQERNRPDRSSEQDEWLEKDQLAMFKVLREEKENSEKRREYFERFSNDEPAKISIGDKRVSNVQIAPNEDYITYSLFTMARGQRTIVPDYVTESGYTEDLNARSKVGSPLSGMEVGIYNIKTGKSYTVKTNTLSGIDEAPEYYADYEKEIEGTREVFTHSPTWSRDGRYAAITFRSKDNKDRWVCLLDANTGEVKELDRQHDEAWIAGPGIGWSYSSGVFGWMPDNERIYFQSEESGYSHLHTINVRTGEKKALTSGEWEVYEPRMSHDKKWWYFEANKSHPGIVQAYKMPLDGGEITAITDLGGRVDAFFSPDERSMAILHSKANMPTELFVIPNSKKPADMVKVTDSPSDEWKSYDWRMPEFVTFQARDGANVHARLYKPESGTNNGPAVIFVHGAGYLQNAHQWWSSYFREYMFHNLLVDKGYTVLDIDYRGSAGYGRDWRTGIYRHMGGFDLTDQVDGAKFLAEEHGIDGDRVGIYGGSYGGFITLMAMFTESDSFAAGAALRSVTDWAHYNHGYTSNILNIPVTDSLAYRKSSPIYYAEGLEGALLICHGIVDTNVHFQDVVRLAQRLIELGKDNWEFAVYPKEAHGFVHPSSWTDEYNRILKLFEDNLK